MNSYRLVEVLNQIEKEIPVNKWKYNNIDVWPIIRNKIGLENSFEKLITDNKLSNFNKMYNKLKKYIQLNLYNLKHIRNRSLSEADVFLLFSSVDRTLFQDKWIIKQAYPILRELDDLSIKTYYLENVNDGSFKLPKEEQSKYIDLNIKRKIVEKFKKVTTNDFFLPNYKDFLLIIAKYNIDIYNYKIDIIKVYIINQLILKDYYKKLLKRSNIKCAIIIGYYGFAYDLISACAELSIPAIDLQHGVAGEIHYAYGRWSNVPLCGYNTLPDKYYTWSKIDEEAINSWAFKTDKHKAIAIGNPWCEFWKEKNSVVDNELNEIRRFYEKKGKPFVLFTHQPPYGFPEWFLQYIKKRDDVYWGIRLHPCDKDDRQIIEDFILHNKTKHINFLETSIFPLPALLSSITVHVTGWSATVFEAVEFSKKSIVIHKKGEEIFSEYMKKELCYFAENEIALDRYLDEIFRNNEIFAINSTEDSISIAVNDIQSLMR